jgi:hypothetical protein
VLSVYSLVKLQVTRSMQIVFLGVGPTEIRIVLAAGMAVAFFIGVPTLVTPFGSLTAFDAVGWLIGIFAVLSAGLMFRQDLRVLAEIDPPRHGVPAAVTMVEVEARRDRHD